MQGLKRIGILISENFYKSNDFFNPEDIEDIRDSKRGIQKQSSVVYANLLLIIS